MKQLLFVFLIVFVGIKAQGQPSLDIGFFGGAGTYFGDMTKIELSKSINPAYAAFVRYNFNPRYGIRFNVLNGNIGAQGEFNTQYINNNPLLTNYWDFKKNVLDISLQFEFNFYKYIVGDKETPYSPYIFGGLGMQTYSYANPLVSGGNNSEISPTIPFGLGFKFNLSKRIGLGLEGGLRKTFSDKLDNLDDPLSQMPNVTTTYTDRYHNNDWTAYAGIHLVYKLMYGYKQWILRTPKEKILDWGIENNPNNR
ncbi:MAG TPA: DUF6089 family protein [Prolixibacteraceae bacterium]|nr:DUF6089 family protein [Prolixibacteraceae bacterium]